MNIDKIKTAIGIGATIVTVLAGYSTVKSSQTADKVAAMEAKAVACTCDCRNAKPVIIQGLKAK